MVMLKKKTRKAIGKNFKKVITKHGPYVAQHLATAVAAATATYLGVGGKKSYKQVKRVAKSIPGKRILKAVSSHLPLFKANSHESNGDVQANREPRRKRRNRSEKDATL